MRDGDPVPDPLGLNELAESINRTMRPQADYSPYTGGQAVPPAAPQQAQTANPGEWQSPYAPPMPDAAQYPASAPGSWQRREPIAAAVLIGLGVLMLLGQLHFLYARVFQFVWPVLLIAAGVWLILRNTRDSQGGSR
jgi:predicted lipid-binding transport protein (Tim44 family)